MKKKPKRPQFSPKNPIGLLGGGQLAQMMALEASHRGFEPHVLSGSSTDPAVQVTRHWQKGSPAKSADLKKFFKGLKYATFESEFYDAQALAEAARSTQTTIHPNLKAMATIQDRLPQKRLLESCRIPTSPFLQVDWVEQLDDVFLELGAFVLKARRGGYDGYGTTIVRNAKELEKAKRSLNPNPSGWIAEKFVPFNREIAVLVARDRFGSIFFYPFVETRQENARCLWVKGPIPVRTSIRGKIRKMLEKLNYVGVMGIEFFDVEGRLLVNELAPRVHNTGHYTQNAFSISQFEMHVDCISGLPMRKPKPLAPAFAMWNLIGESQRKPRWDATYDNVQLHWYGKDEARPGRKMGHLNAIGDSPEAALAKVKKTRKAFQL